jgi:phosphate transport system substrate-binding protein
MATAFMANFTNTNADELEITSSKTDGAYQNLINGDADVILVVEPSEDELKIAEDAGVELVSYKVANEGFVFFTNTENSVDNLSLEQIQKIYTGEIKNWSEVGGDDQSIIAYQRPANSGSQTGMLSLVMKGLNIMEAPTKDVVSTMEAIIDLVADYKNNPGAIGYSYYYFANSMYSKDELKLLSVDGVAPTNETIKSGEYPIETAYYIVIKKSDENNEDVMKLVNAMLGTRGQKVVEESGYVSIK